jgi:superfamily II DNA or RNA helicase
MNHFDIKGIEYVAKQTRVQGLNYFIEERVLLTSVIAKHIKAQVKGENSFYDVEIDRSNSGNIKADFSSCTCPAFSRYGETCKHIVATAYSAQNFLNHLRPRELAYLKQGYDLIEDNIVNTNGTSQSDSDSRMLPFAPDKPKKELRKVEKRTDQLARQLMERKSQRALEQLGGLRLSQEPLHLEATLTFESYHGYYLTLKVGAARLYVVKDLSEFKRAILNEQSLTFGTSTMLWLSRSAFDEASKPLLEFFLTRYSDTTYNNYYYYSPPTPKKMMMVNRSHFDDLFAALIDREFNLVDKDKAYETDGSSSKKGKGQGKAAGKADACRLAVAEDPRLSISLTSFADGAQLEVMENFSCIYGLNHLHFINEDKVRTCSAGYSDACLDLLSAISDAKGKLYFHSSDLPFLFSTVLPDIIPYLDIQIEQDLQQFAPPPLTIRIYLDVDEDGGIVARMTFSYGDITHNAFETKDFSKSYERSREILAEELLISFMGTQRVAPGALKLPSNDEEAVFLLATKGIEALEAIAELYVSDSFDRIKVRPPATASVGVKVDGRLLTIDFDIEDIDFDEIATIMAGYRKAKRYVRLRDGSFLSLEDGSIPSLTEMLDSLELSDAALAKGKGHVELDVSKSMFVDSLIQRSGNLEFSRDESLRSIVHAMQEAAEASYALPEELSDVLRGYQRAGYRWLRTIESLRFGGILADDMGLGKTLQVLSLLSAKKQEGALKRPSVVVCPASLVLNWASEAQRFTPELVVVPQLGNTSERQRLIERIAEIDLLVTSYDQLRRDVNAYTGKDLDFVILDEAQMIKNQNTQNAKAVKKLNGQTMLALTGTPIENNLAELWSIFDFLMPGYLYNYTHFQRRFEKPIVKNNDEVVTERLRTLVRPFILRRLKSEVLKELPPKIESSLVVEMGEKQRALYLGMMAQTKKELAIKLAESTGQQGRIAVLAALTRLRQLCCDPALVYEEYKDGSAKLDACLELVTNCLNSGHRILLFSQFTSMLDIIESRLRSRLVRFFRLDGSTPKQERMALVTAFNGGEVPVFLISLKAGGTGLNLTGADVVIHFDPWWNLSAQNQATDRTHRIGQTRTVQVFKLIAKDSIEERIQALQERKAALAESIIQQGGNAFDSLTSEELLALFDEE